LAYLWLEIRSKIDLHNRIEVLNSLDNKRSTWRIPDFKISIWYR